MSIDSQVLALSGDLEEIKSAFNALAQAIGTDIKSLKTNVTGLENRDVLQTPLTGLSLAVGTTLVATDTLLAAVGKLQKQITNNKAIAPSSGTLVGMVTTVDGVVVPTDTILRAIGKLQRQITLLNNRVNTIETSLANLTTRVTNLEA